ncbi:hypothetical protein ACTFIU_000045 [Dictyostelium citrinum]
MLADNLNNNPIKPKLNFSKLKKLGLFASSLNVYPTCEVSNLIFDDSNSSSSSSSSSVSSSSGYIPRSINQGVNRVNSSSDSTTMEVGGYSTFQSHVKSIINTQKPGTTELFMIVFMDYLTYLFKLKPTLAYSTINSHRSMLNQLLFLKNQIDVAHDPLILKNHEH